MKDYIFIEEKTKKVIGEKNFEGNQPASKSVGYAEALSKKNNTKVCAYCKVKKN